jgi:imidazolonepropionase
MPLLTDISVLYTCRMAGAQSDVHPIHDAAVAWKDGIITWVGPAREAPEDETVYSADRHVVVPGLIDCHTHLCFGGWRADEFEQRLKGKSYQEIARKGGGILRTVQQTREASEEALFEHGETVLREMAALGVTAVECKSGYGLSRESELRLLRVYDALKTVQPLDIAATFLGAHVVPSEFAEDRDAYVELLSEELIPRIAEERLAEFCDVFVEEAAFTPEEADRILRAGMTNGLRPKLHVDQLSDGGGATLAARVGAVSADHLEYASQEGMEAMAWAGVVAVCLPLATLYLAQKPMPAREFLRAGVRIAVATDFNPGSAPSFDLPLAMMLSCTMNRLTPAEALKGATIHAALAMGREDVAGSIEVGKRADMAVLDAPDVNHWLYHFRPNACLKTYIRGLPQD